MYLKYFMKLPRFFINKLLPNIKTLLLISISKINNGYLYQFNVPSSNSGFYQTSILINNNIISDNSLCKFRCTCDSFKYQYENILYSHDALIGKPNIIKPPKQNKLFVCKHLYITLQLLYKFNNLNY